MKMLSYRAAIFALILNWPLVAARPWDQPFAKDTLVIVEAASNVASAANPEVIVLLDEHRYLIRSDGRTDQTIRKVFRIVEKDAIEDWSSVEQAYQPWYQQKPEIRARVIQPDGSAKMLDPATIADAPSREFDSSIYSDARVARAPLPAVTVGSVVEFEINVRDKAPLLDAGVARRVAVADYIPTERFHVMIQAEPGVMLQIASKLIPESAIHREADGKGTRVEFEITGIEPRKHREFNLPPDETESPYLSFSNGRSWQSVASRYEAIVNQRLQSADLKAFMAGIDLQGKPQEIAARLSSKLHAAVRYTGVEFGEAAIVPATPAETLGRGYGDCKDKASLLVAMLRAAGLRADVALLNSGFGTDVDRDLPGMGMFDHAIVYVGADPPLWIDATAAETRVGVLPSVDQGRLALIANRETTVLIRTPEAAPAETWRRITAEVRMSESGAGMVHEVEEAGGEFEANLRTAFGSDQKKTRDQLEQYAKRAYAAKSIGKFEIANKEDWSTPFRVSVEVLQAATANTGPDDAGVALLPSRVFEDLPFTLRGGFEDADEKDKAGPRRKDLLLPHSYNVEYRYKIFPPRLYKATTKTESEEVKLGPAVYSRSLQANPDGTFEVSYRFDTGKRRLTAAEFETFREALKKHNTPANEVIVFVPETSEYLALGQTGKALALLRTDTEQHKDSAMAHVRLSRMLLSAGLGTAALREAKIATELEPKSGAAWMALGAVYEHDTFGRALLGNWNQAEAERCFRKALEADADDPAANSELAVLLEHNAWGERYAKDARVDEAVAIYQALLKKQPNPVLQQNLSVLLLRLGRYDVAKEEAKKTAPELQAVLRAVITAVQESPARALVGSQTAYPDPRQRAIHLSSVAMTLMSIREYRAAQTIMSAAARLLTAPELQTRSEMLAKIKRWEEVLVKEDDPRWPAQQLLLEILRDNPRRETFEQIITKRQSLDGWDEGMADMRGSLGFVRQQMATAGLSGETLTDMMISMLSFEKEGTEERGYRLTATGPTGALSLFVAKEDGRYRIIGVPPDGTETLGELVLELLDKKDLEGARWWLDQAVKGLQARSDGTGRPAVHGLWSGVTEQTRGPAAILIAANALIGAGKASELALQELRSARPKAANALERSQIDKAICESLAKGKKWDELVVAAKRLGENKLFSEEGFRYLIKGASGAGKWKELETEAQKRVSANPLNLAAIRALALALSRQGDFGGAVEWAKKMVADTTADDDERIVAGWIAMLAGKADTDSLAVLKKESATDRSTSKYHYTLAMMQATLDQPEEAYQALLKGLAREDYSHVNIAGWAAYGKICEQYGYPEDAETSFAHAREARKSDAETAEWILPLLKLKTAPQR